MDTDGIPLLEAGETALAHALRLVRDERTGGALVLASSRAIDPYCATTFGVVIQRYPREVAAIEELRAVADARNGRVSLIEGVTGVVANFWIPGAGAGWAWPPEGEAEDVVTPSGQRCRIETPPCVLCLVEADEPATLAALYRDWVDPWQTPVVLLTGDVAWLPEWGEAPGVDARAAMTKDSFGHYAIVYTQATAASSFPEYRHYRIRVNRELADYLAT